MREIETHLNQSGNSGSLQEQHLEFQNLLVKERKFQEDLLREFQTLREQCPTRTDGTSTPKPVEAGTEPMDLESGDAIKAETLLGTLELSVMPWGQRYDPKNDILETPAKQPSANPLGNWPGITSNYDPRKASNAILAEKEELRIAFWDNRLPENQEIYQTNTQGEVTLEEDPSDESEGELDAPYSDDQVKRYRARTFSYSKRCPFPPRLRLHCYTRRMALENKRRAPLQLVQRELDQMGYWWTIIYDLYAVDPQSRQRYQRIPKFNSWKTFVKLVSGLAWLHGQTFGPIFHTVSTPNFDLDEKFSYTVMAGPQHDLAVTAFITPRVRGWLRPDYPKFIPSRNYDNEAWTPLPVPEGVQHTLEDNRIRLGTSGGNINTALLPVVSAPPVGPTRQDSDPLHSPGQKRHKSRSTERRTAPPPKTRKTSELPLPLPTMSSPLPEPKFSSDPRYNILPYLNAVNQELVTATERYLRTAQVDGVFVLPPSTYPTDLVVIPPANYWIPAEQLAEKRFPYNHYLLQPNGLRRPKYCPYNRKFYWTSTNRWVPKRQQWAKWRLINKHAPFTALEMLITFKYLLKIVPNTEWKPWTPSKNLRQKIASGQISAEHSAYLHTYWAAKEAEEYGAHTQARKLRSQLRDEYKPSKEWLTLKHDQVVIDQSVHTVADTRTVRHTSVCGQPFLISEMTEADASSQPLAIQLTPEEVETYRDYIPPHLDLTLLEGTKRLIVSVARTFKDSALNEQGNVTDQSQGTSTQESMDVDVDPEVNQGSSGVQRAETSNLPKVTPIRLLEGPVQLEQGNSAAQYWTETFNRDIREFGQISSDTLESCLRSIADNGVEKTEIKGQLEALQRSQKATTDSDKQSHETIQKLKARQEELRMTIQTMQAQTETAESKYQDAMKRYMDANLRATQLAQTLRSKEAELLAEVHKPKLTAVHQANLRTLAKLVTDLSGLTSDTIELREDTPLPTESHIIGDAITVTSLLQLGKPYLEDTGVYTRTVHPSKEPECVAVVLKLSKPDSDEASKTLVPPVETSRGQPDLSTTDEYSPSVSSMGDRTERKTSDDTPSQNQTDTQSQPTQQQPTESGGESMPDFEEQDTLLSPLLGFTGPQHPVTSEDTNTITDVPGTSDMDQTSSQVNTVHESGAPDASVDRAADSFGTMSFKESTYEEMEQDNLNTNTSVPLSRENNTAGTEPPRAFDGVEITSSPLGVTQPGPVVVDLTQEEDTAPVAPEQPETIIVDTSPEWSVDVKRRAIRHQVATGQADLPSSPKIPTPHLTPEMFAPSVQPLAGPSRERADEDSPLDDVLQGKSRRRGRSRGNKGSSTTTRAASTSLTRKEKQKTTIKTKKGKTYKEVQQVVATTVKSSNKPPSPPPSPGAGAVSASDGKTE